MLWVISWRRDFMQGLPWALLGTTVVIPFPCCCSLRRRARIHWRRWQRLSSPDIDLLMASGFETHITLMKRKFLRISRYRQQRLFHKWLHRNFQVLRWARLIQRTLAQKRLAPKLTIKPWRVYYIPTDVRYVASGHRGMLFSLSPDANLPNRKHPILRLLLSFSSMADNDYFVSSLLSSFSTTPHQFLRAELRAICFCGAWPRGWRYIFSGFGKTLR